MGPACGEGEEAHVDDTRRPPRSRRHGNWGSDTIQVPREFIP